MRRRRLTWKDSRKATSDLPNEGYDHPADQGQQKAEKYFIDNDGNGVGSEPSDFAEDVHQPPYNKGEAPATPNEGYDHPAMKQAAHDIRIATERKASKCIRIAQATLGHNASLDAIEDQALAFMNMADEDVEATLGRMSEYAMPMAQDAQEATTMFADEDAELEEMMAEFLATHGEEAEEAEHYGEEAQEAQMLAEMLAEEAMPMASEEEAMLAEMLAEEADMMADHHEDHGAEEAEHYGEKAEHYGEKADMMADELMLAEEDHDAMGLGDLMAEDELLAGLFAEKMASDEEEKEEDKEEEKEEAKEEDKAEEKEEDKEEESEEEEEKAEKKASRLKPRARKASKGVKTLGNVSKSASSELSDLSKLWESAPNITDLFQF